ncbi:MAG: imidazole glycerol phosphate synthase subunit HisH, partial [Clostridia bacterium]|nr:imidazole glycerol phosphate synthase subunit HisH [Clostridia bacterium]
PIFNYVQQGDYVYFVHSYFAKCKEGLSATTDYGMPVTAAVSKNNIFGVQFHPEKSGEAGLNILRAFNEL